MSGDTRPAGTRWIVRTGALLLAAACLWLAAAAQTNNECDEPGETPDVIVGDLHQAQRDGNFGGITAFSIGTVSCNIGSCWLNWFGNSANHPVIAQNMFRLKDGRFEQIGQSWLKHGFNALSQELCSSGCMATIGTHLGVNCSDPYSASTNSNQTRLGPKFEVNPATGVFPFPATDMNNTGGPIYKRLQVHDVDLDPASNAGADYFVEGHYVAADDAAAGNQNNNASWRPVNVIDSGGGVFDLQLTEFTRREEPAILAWRENDAGVDIVNVDVPNDGRLIVGARATDLGGGNWHYEYAVHNLNSHRAVEAFEVPLPFESVPANAGFHDVDYHSGEPFDGTDWASSVDTSGDPHALVWQTDPIGVNADANALRWGTLYNFRLEEDARPVFGDVTLRLFRAGSPASVSTRTIVPSPCDADGLCEAGETLCNCPDCGTPPLSESACGDGVDDDCDGLTDCADGDCCTDPGCAGPDADADTFAACDCNDDDPDVWLPPGEVRDLALAKDAVDGTVISWIPPAEPGAVSLQYQTLRSGNPADFIAGGACLPDAVGGDTSAADADDPAVGIAFYYLVRGINGCDSGEGSLGRDSSGIFRAAIGCP